MAAAGQQCQAALCLGLGFRLGEDTTADGHNRVGRQHQASRWRHRYCLGAGDSQRIGAWQLGAQGRFIDLGGDDAVGDDPDLAQQIQPPWASRSQDQRRAARVGLGYLKRKVMRPLLRS
jgi:hypothetical protein